MNHSQKSLAGLLIEAFEPEMSKYPVLPYHGNKVRSNTYHKKVQKRYKTLKRDTVFS